MKCPHCANTALVMSDRQGVEIDYCPQCRGIWLDRGELDKLLERAATAASAPAAGYPQRPPEYRGDHYPQRKHKSWLSEIFD